METLRTINDLDKDGEANQITDFATARRLIEEIYREAGEWYDQTSLKRSFVFFKGGRIAVIYFESMIMGRETLSQLPYYVYSTLCFSVADLKPC